MADIQITGPGHISTPLQAILMSEAIMPGSPVSYEMCKILRIFHPLGAKIVEKPLEIAQSQQRDLVCPNAPSQVVEAFKAEWEAVSANKVIKNTAASARCYGVSSLGLVEDGVKFDSELDFRKLYKQKITFNMFDPLNTAGSLVLNQNPNAMDFQHVTQIAVAGQPYHRSRTVTLMNEEPIYLAYTTSAFGYVGRSCFQRALFPLKSFVQTMLTDDMVARKAGVIVYKAKSPGAIIDNVTQWMYAIKRQIIKEAENYNVITIGSDEIIESINLTNLEGPLKIARSDILENIAFAVPMPAKLMTEEEFAATFSEGSEDAKAIARYIDLVREWLQPLYTFMDKVVFHRAINPDFYKTIQKLYPEQYGEVDFDTAFYYWWSQFKSQWPSLLKEPESELSKAEKVRLEAVIGMLEMLLPNLRGENRANLIMWAVDNFNEMKVLFTGASLELDYEDIADDEGPVAEDTPGHSDKTFALDDDPNAPRVSHRDIAKVLSLLDRRDGARSGAQRIRRAFDADLRSTPDRVSDQRRSGDRAA